MAISKILKIKSSNHIVKVIDYIALDSKVFSTNEKLVTTFSCFGNGKNINNQFKLVQDNNIRHSVKARHIIQSFSNFDNITPELSHKIACEFCEILLENKYQYVIATHIDKDNIHNHIIFNNVSFVDYKCFYDSKIMYEKKIKKINDDLAKKYNLSIIKNNIDKNIFSKENFEKKTFKKRKSNRDFLKEDIIFFANISSNFDELISYLKSKYIVKDTNKNISFKEKSAKKFIRLSSLGLEFSKENLINFFNEKEKSNLCFEQFLDNNFNNKKYIFSKNFSQKDFIFSKEISNLYFNFLKNICEYSGDKNLYFIDSNKKFMDNKATHIHFGTQNSLKNFHKANDIINKYSNSLNFNDVDVYLDTLQSELKIMKSDFYKLLFEFEKTKSKNESTKDLICEIDRLLKDFYSKKYLFDTLYRSNYIVYKYNNISIKRRYINSYNEFKRYQSFLKKENININKYIVK